MLKKKYFFNLFKSLYFSIRLASKLLIRNKKTTVFIVLIFSLILSLPSLTKSVTEGFGIKIKEDISGFIGDYILKTNKNQDLSILYNKLNKMYFIDFYIPTYNINSIFIDKKGNELGTNLMIIDKFDKFVHVNKLESNLLEGDLGEGRLGLILGKETVSKYQSFSIFPKTLEVESGSLINTIFNYKIGNKNIKFDKNIKVLGIYSKGEPGMDIYVLASKKLLELNGIEFKPNSIIIFLKEKYKDSEYVKKEIFSEFSNYKIRVAKNELATIDAFLKIFDIISSITFYFGTIIILIIIYALISINVRNKRIEIGILRALGIKEGTIILIYTNLTIFYLILSFFLSLLILYITQQYFIKNPIPSPFGEVIPKIDYLFFISNFFKLFILLIIISIIPVKSVVNEDLLDQVRS